MANIAVIPTRMELTRLKGKLKTARRGHKLLKDKRDGLMKQFLETVREVRALRAEVEEELMTVHKSFTVVYSRNNVIVGNIKHHCISENINVSFLNLLNKSSCVFGT